MKFAVKGNLYDFDLDHLTFDEGEAVEEYTGYSPEEFGRAVMGSRVKAMRAMVYLAMKRNGEEVEWADLGDIDLMELSLSIIEENDIDLSTAANGEDVPGVALLAEKIKERKAAKGANANRATRRAANKK